MNARGTVERPHFVWWIAVIGGLTILALQSFNPAVYDWWAANVNPLPARWILGAIFLACIPLHAGEAIYAYRLSNRLGTPEASRGWAMQTFLLGFPSTRLIMKRVRAEGTRIPVAASR